MLLYFIAEPYLLFMLLIFSHYSKQGKYVFHFKGQPIVAKNLFCGSEFSYLSFAKKQSESRQIKKIRYHKTPEKHSEHNALQSLENPESTD